MVPDIKRRLLRALSAATSYTNPKEQAGSLTTERETVTTTTFNSPFNCSMLDDLIQASLVKQDSPEHQNKVTPYELTDDGRARGK